MNAPQTNGAGRRISPGEKGGPWPPDNRKKRAGQRLKICGRIHNVISTGARLSSSSAAVQAGESASSGDDVFDAFVPLSRGLALLMLLRNSVIL